MRVRERRPLHAKIPVGLVGSSGTEEKCVTANLVVVRHDLSRHDLDASMQKAHATLKYDPRHRNVLRHEALVPRYGLCQDMLAAYQDTLSQCTARCVATPNRNACIIYIYYAKAVGKIVIHWITSLTACATVTSVHIASTQHTWDFTHQKTQWLHCRHERT